MLNREKYGDKILTIICSGSYVAVVNDVPVPCKEADCEECLLYKGNCSCSEKLALWLNSECVEPFVDWSKVAVDTKILVKQKEFDEWKKRYFCKYENGTVYAWECGTTSWSMNVSEACTTGWNYAKLAEVKENEEND